jgi:uncharacterized protein (DUF885 family)
MKKLINHIHFLLVIVILSACQEPTDLIVQTQRQSLTSESTTAVENRTESRIDPYKDLSFDDYLETTYRDLKLRTPEAYVELGLESIYGEHPIALNDLSLAYQEETYAIYQTILDGLVAYDYAALSPEQKQSYTLYQYWLQDILKGYEFRFNEYIDSGFDILSASANTEFFFSDIHPMEDLADADDFLVRLDGVDEKIGQISDRMQASSQAGIIPPQILFPRLMDRVEYITVATPTSISYYKSLKSKLDLLEDINETTKDDLLAQAKTIIEQDIKPAYQNYLDVLNELYPQAPKSIGVNQYPNGDAYYQYLLHFHTTTNMTPEEIYDLGLTELDRVHAEMRAVFNELGYPDEESLESLYGKVASESGFLTGTEIQPGYEAIIENAASKLDTAFETLPQQEVIVIPDQFGGFYVPGSVDGSRLGAFYAAMTGQVQKYTMPTLTYHETVPGHHLQIALAQELDLPTFRRVEFSTGYVEGWALYAERLAYELGWYDDDPYGNLGRLQYEAFRAARLVVDTAIHSMGWDFNQAVAFFAENTCFSTSFSHGQIYRYIAYPGQATAYMVGMLKILELRETVQDKIGEDFDIKVFHQMILNSGSIPLDLLETQVLESLDR